MSSPMFGITSLSYWHDFIEACNLLSHKCCSCICSSPDIEDTSPGNLKEFSSSKTNSNDSLQDIVIKDPSLEGLCRNKLSTISCRIFELIHQNYTEVVKNELDQFSDVQRKFIVKEKHMGHTMLSLATISAQTDLMRYLLEHCDADIEQRDTNGTTPVTPLWLAVERRNVEAVDILLEHDADVNAKGEGDCPIILLAAQNVNLQIVESLILSGANMNASDEWGYTPLHAALWNMGLMRLLMENGADLNAKDQNGDTMLHLSVRKGFFEMCKFLLMQEVNPYEVNIDGYDAFQLAALYGECEILVYLLITFPYPKECPKEFFNEPTKIKIKEMLETYVPKDYSLDLHALLAIEKVLGPTCDKTFYALKEAAELTSRSMDFAQSWIIYIHLLQICHKPHHVLDSNVITGIFQLLYNIFCEYGEIIVPVERALGIFNGMFRDVICNLNLLQRRESGKEDETFNMGRFQEVFIRLLNLLEFITKLKSSNTGSSSSDKVFLIIPLPCILFDVVSPLNSEQVLEKIDDSQTLVCVRVHGRWEYLDVFLAQEDLVLTTKGRCVKTYHYLETGRRQLIPSKIPLPLQCLAMQVIQVDNVPYENILPPALCNTVEHH
ncbi:uncharacterized protein LOC106884030 isoform X2 [Octopus bimaculoides]|uniref:Uncharacterized protein n=2 Tax=Octopus bimaculoides TaxID=37653 RepID=A0A0L8I5P9_OCTBM|nr:uncharacterized protein LOC106884030 isoform X2 [Octopus bimaculoides]XP_014790701.1 uncharacterized protein LOC106884030 isoform X2 [Octopus bimaculoides]XP_014790702.1 uncharacterized protein LOC106884030 isoform X2 [Octopus bimaculoides]XP_014790703.1 uncharacterized protein LOC106884030 isoform X2 [Octopus bimaculoides]XP_014790704.1 uncharacterized protein LOC106884030 isoform X2 [Octopus bimaculoides]XP_014790705.1 uncharacterized protein LOC106884030 isoform X2 [Octopus bimaculoides]|eukprot:XP_014790700.1 PREDICTED: uncharacterized protein LOC106884030 isoform X2 [Octopus bimaculoides]